MFKQASESLNLLENDIHWEHTIKKSVLSKNTNLIKELFVILMIMCGLTDPKKISKVWK